jgi:hypothetical protein
VWVRVRVSIVAASLVAGTGCFDHSGSGGLISEQAALGIAAQSGWHPDRITTRLTTYRPHPDRPRTRKVWIVTYRGGDVCVPGHGPSTAGLGVTNVGFTIDAHTGKVLSEGASGLPVDCMG